MPPKIPRLLQHVAPEEPVEDTLETPGAAAVAAPAAAPQAQPRPHVVHAAWYPAGIVLPGPERRILSRVKIFAADTGLYVFTAADESAPAWYSPIDYGKTRAPSKGIMAANGIPIVTTAGAALITPMGGCGCGSALKRWVPSWAVMEAKWPTSA